MRARFDGVDDGCETGAELIEALGVDGRRSANGHA
jgi:hypothetical protein